MTQTTPALMKGSILTSFRTKFIALIGAAVLLSLLLSGAVALWNVRQLSRDASREIESGLSEATEEYVTRYIQSGGTAALGLDQVPERERRLVAWWTSTATNADARNTRHLAAAS